MSIVLIFDGCYIYLIFMREFYSKAIVLGRKDSGEVDAVIDLFTEDFGKISAWAKSVKKIKSKLSGHLQPMSFVKARFIQRSGPKDGWSMIDCISDDDFSDFYTKERYDLLPLINFLNKYLFEFQSDRKLWAFLSQIFLKKYDTNQTSKALLKIMGFDPDKSSCAACHSNLVGAFKADSQIFLCQRCALKFNPNELLLFK